jgi:hypothetical protein
MQRPSALGLMLCDQIIIDRDSMKPSLIGLFTGMGCSRFPSTPRQIEVFADLTDGQGQIDLVLVVSHLETNEQLSTYKMPQEFPSPLHVVHVRFRLPAISFAVEGICLFELHALGEAICHRRVRVYQREDLT